MHIPYISFVVPTRNDDYAPNMLLRQQACQSTFIEQLERHGLDSEIILVEWNPPPDRAPLKDALVLPKTSSHVSIRIITVDPLHHRKFRYWERRGVNTDASMNVGIRRARSPYTVCRLADVFYSEALVRFLARKSLSQDNVYRCDRLDVDPAVLNDVSDGTLAFLESCERNVLCRHRPWDGEQLGLPRLHTNGPGDFMLMSREYWRKIRGFYVAKEVCSLDSDPMAMHQAVAAGAKEVRLPDEYCLYKLAHGGGTNSRVGLVTSPGMDTVRKTLKRVIGRDALTWLAILLNVPKRRVKGLDGAIFDSNYRNYIFRAWKWSKGIGPVYLNGEDWGLASEDLPEVTVCRAAWESNSRKRSSD